MPQRWTRDTLHDLITDRLSGFRFIAVSNREPYIHRFREPGAEIEVMLPASGMATALDPILRASGGTWVAHGSGDADRHVVDHRDRVAVPPENPLYTLRRVFLPPDIERGYYMGLANSGLWPLCHIAYHRPVFRLSDWEDYRKANQLFADAVLEEAQGEPAFVFVQDYHFGLLPRILKNANPNLIVAQFWHIPWPNREVFRVFPWKEELLDGMLGNDVLGFHLRYHCQNFLDTVDRNIEALVDVEHSTITRGGRGTMIRPFPISIDFDEHSRLAARAEVDSEIAWWTARLNGRPEILGGGIERIDYTKGIPDRLTAIDLLLEQKPELRGRFQFVQVAVPSRSDIEDYASLSRVIDRQVEEINAKWRLDGWEPVHYLREHCGPARMMALHRMANFFVVSSLHDGMNLVAKEFVASRFDLGGSLILSRFTGAARELLDALLVNPYSVDEMASAMWQAISMKPEEQSRRMQNLRTTVEDNNVYRWAGKLILALLKIEQADRRESDDLADLAESAIP